MGLLCMVMKCSSGSINIRGTLTLVRSTAGFLQLVRRIKATLIGADFAAYLVRKIACTNWCRLYTALSAADLTHVSIRKDFVQTDLMCLCLGYMVV